jgi:hypothetical protein
LALRGVQPEKYAKIIRLALHLSISTELDKPLGKLKEDFIVE